MKFLSIPTNSTSVTPYFVAETKSAGQELRSSEERKTKCGHAHFKEFEGVKYRQVATVGELDY